MPFGIMDEVKPVQYGVMRVLHSVLDLEAPPTSSLSSRATGAEASGSMCEPSILSYLALFTLGACILVYRDGTICNNPAHYDGFRSE